MRSKYRSNRKICESYSVNLIADGEYVSCIWLDDSSLDKTSLTVKLQGYYWVDAFTVCGSDQDSVYIEVRPLPGIDLGRDTFIEFNSSVTLIATPGYDNYLWQDGSTSFEYYTEAPGIFWVDVSDDIGCKSSDAILIEPLFINIFVPTAFSPNGDNLNDVFVPISAYEVTMDYNMMIFNRFGEMVFESDKFDYGWDGSYIGNPCPVEVYTWYIHAEPRVKTIFFSKPVELSGNVTLLR